MQPFSNLTSIQQQALFQKVKQLKADGLGYKRIIKKIKLEDEIALAKSTLSYWFNHGMSMVGGENFFEPVPSSELSYFIGVMFGDGFLGADKKTQDYFLGLKANDKDFVENFSNTLVKILRKKKPFYVCQGADDHFSTKARSKRLYFFTKSLKDDFGKAKPFIEAFPAEFISGLADSEGSVSFSPKYHQLNVAVAYSTNFELLRFVQELLKERFDIQSALRKHKKAGEADSIIDGRLIVRTKDLFSLTLKKKRDCIKFHGIDFSIHRKKQRLGDGLFLLKKNKKEAQRIWYALYHKEGHYWRRNTLMPIKEFEKRIEAPCGGIEPPPHP